MNGGTKGCENLGDDMQTTAFFKYFEPKGGAWEGEYLFTLVDARTLWYGDLSRVQCVLFVALAITCRLVGALRIQTTVDTAGIEAGRVVHTTRISKWGMTLQRSTETFVPQPDGLRFEIDGDLSMAPFPWIRWHYTGSWGRVDEQGERASYRLAWRGAYLSQQTAMQGTALAVAQETDGCRAEFALRPCAG